MENGDVEVHCKYDTLVNVKALSVNPNNANAHSEKQIQRLSELIKYQGIRASIIVSRQTNYIVKGHATLEALKRLKLENAPVSYQNFNNQEQEIAFLHSDNSISGWSELDFKIINSQIPDFDPSFNLDLLGIEKFELDPSEKPKKKKKCPDCGCEF